MLNDRSCVRLRPGRKNHVCPYYLEAPNPTNSPQFGPSERVPAFRPKLVPNARGQG